MDTKRILFAIPRLTIGGGELFVVNLVNELTLSFPEYVFGLLNLNLRNFDLNNPLKQNLVVRENLQYMECTVSRYLRYRMIRKLIFRFLPSYYFSYVKEKASELVSSFKPDIICTHLIKSDRIITSLKLNIPIIIVDHGDYKFPFKDRKDLIEYAHTVVCVSKSNKDSLYNEFGAENLTVIENGVPVFKHIMSKEELGIDKDKFIFLMTARGVRDKGWIEAIFSFRNFKYYELSSLVLVGDGEGIAEAKNYVKENDIANVIFVGFISDVSQYVVNCDATILPTYIPTESLPLSILEGIVHEKPAISTKLGSIPEIIENEDGQDAGIVIPLDGGFVDTAKLIDAMNLIYEDYDFYKKNTKLKKDQYKMHSCAVKYFKLCSEIFEETSVVVS